MLDVLKVASYLYKRYSDTYGVQMDEMKLHKLLYFTQRESYVLTGQPMFAERFHAWKYGPVMLEIRDLYRTKKFEDIDSCVLEPYKAVFDFVFEEYAHRNSWDLSMLTHGEYCWKKARGNTPIDKNCSNEICPDDIMIDAARIKTKRFFYDLRMAQMAGK